MSVRPLSGVRVLDLGIAIAGPAATLIFADLGAQVIKIEPVFGDGIHGELGPVVPLPPGATVDRPYNRRLFFNEKHRGKLDINLDLSQDAGRTVFRKLVARSDIVLENFRPRVMKRFGLDYDNLKVIKDDIIMVSLSGFGSTGPYADRIAFGPGIYSTSGLGYLTGYADGPPVKAGNTYFSDYFAGMNAAFATLAALAHRNSTGAGQRVEVAMREVETLILGEAIIDYTMNGRVQARSGNLHPGMAPHGGYRCQGEDSWITIAVGSEDDWARLVRVMGNPAWAGEDRFRTGLERWRHQEDLDRLLEGWTSRFEHRQLMAFLQEAGIAAGAVLTMGELFEDPQIKARNAYVEMDHPEMGRITARGAPWTMSETPLRIDTPSPCFGEHIDYVLRDLLGMSEESVRELEEAKVIAREPL